MSKKKLMLVESPHKSKSIQGFLGTSQYKVIPTIGSMFDIDNPTTEAQKKKYDHYGVDTTTWDLNLKCTNAKQLALIKAELNTGNYDELIVSTDPDRAGSQIGQEVVDSLAPILKKQSITVSRATWQEVTKKAVEAGLKTKGVINQLEVDAAKGRQTYDRLFGFAISGNVQKTIREKSAGRVQSPALRLIVDREKERLAFVKADYMSITGMFHVGVNKNELAAKLVTIGPKKIAVGGSFDSKGQVKNNEQIITPGNVEKLKTFLTKCDYAVTDVSTKPYSRKPPTPYTTSTFQQDVGTRLRLSSKQIMAVAQQLFDQGFISYMRTDSPHLGDEALAAAFKEAKKLFPKDVPAQATVYKAKGQGGHEAIRPVCDEKTGDFRAPLAIKAALDKVDKNGFKVYEAVYNRTVASQMNPAVGFTTTVKISSTNTPDDKTAVFSTAATTFTSLGWMALTKPVEEEESANVISDKIEKGEDALLKKLVEKEHSTNPPARYTEPQLVLKLEETGIGRPSTYASIVTVNQNRGYVEKKGGQMYPTWAGMKVAQYLEGKIPNFVAYQATANMEDELDKIEQGQMPKDAFLKKEWAAIQKDVLSLNDNIKWDEVNDLSTIDLHNGYVVRVNSFGSFLEDTNAPLVDGKRVGAKLADSENVAELDFSDPEVCKAIFEASKNRVGARELGELQGGNYVGWTVTARDGKFGAYVQAAAPEVVKAYAAGEKPTPKMPKPVNHALPEGLELGTITLADVEPLFAEVKLPRTLSDNFFVGRGAKGQYIGNKATAKTKRATFISLPEEFDPRTVTLDEVKKLWEDHQTAKNNAPPSIKKEPAKKTAAKPAAKKAAPKKAPAKKAAPKK